MDRRAAWVIGVIFGGLFFCLFGFLFILYTAVKAPGGSFKSGDRVGVVEIVGEIKDSKKVLEQLREFRDSDPIKAVVVRVGPAPSTSLGVNGGAPG